MKTLSPAMTQLLSSVGQSGQNDPVVAGAPTGEHPFTLATAENTGPLMQRLVQAKNHATEAKSPPALADDGAMQAMLAMLLSQPATPDAAKGVQAAPVPTTDSNIAVHLAAKQQAGAPLQMALKQAISGQQSAQRPPLPLKAQALPPELQQWVAQLAASGDVSLTPEQQAKLAALHVQDPKQVVQTAQPHPRLHEENQHLAATGQHRPAGKEKAVERTSFTPSVAAPLNVAQAANADKANAMEMAKMVPLAQQPDELGEKLTGLLKERIHFQINQQEQISTIRLDPPSLGKLDIAIQLDAGKLTVHIGATQPDVCRTLQQLSDQLRQQLTGQNFTQVEVHVSPDGGSEQQQRQRRQQQSDDILTARAIASEQDSGQQRDPLLITV
ncbi:flagellar hook-length control protein FliK [Siccibacter turicensis]|nr:flagellar hook-length control protein FliK [Siccibacter turicensis]